MGVIDRARKLRGLLVRAAVSLTDQEASRAPELMQALHGGGQEIPAGTRISWRGQVLRAAVTCWDRQECWPDRAPELWEALAYKDGWRIIPEVITRTGAFAKGERGWWKGTLYESLVEDNVYTPEQAGANWEEVTV